MSYTPEHKLMQEYIVARNQLKASMVAESQQTQEKVLNEIKANYADLLRIHYRKLEESPATKLKVIQKRLEDIFELLNAWQSYVDVIYMSEIEVNMMEQSAEDAKTLGRKGFDKRRQE